MSDMKMNIVWYRNTDERLHWFMEDIYLELAMFLLC